MVWKSNIIATNRNYDNDSSLEELSSPKVIENKENLREQRNSSVTVDARASENYLQEDAVDIWKPFIALNRADRMWKCIFRFRMMKLHHQKSTINAHKTKENFLFIFFFPQCTEQSQKEELCKNHTLETRRWFLTILLKLHSTPKANKCARTYLMKY